MLKIKSGARKLNNTNLLQRATLHVERMKSNADFATDTSLIAEGEAAISALQASINEQHVAAIKVQEASLQVQEARNNAIAMIEKLARKVSLASIDNPNVIYDLGFDAADEPIRPNKIDPPQHLTLTESNGTAKLEASVLTVKGAKGYIVQINYDINDAQGWETHLNTTRTRNTLSNLKSGKKVWVRVAALGAAGQSDWSDVATRIVP